ncbi:MAG: hypothetical protein Q4B26_17785, partial [Eubacteriales bacterium]|nr:hypothetical protein [Eubacteriales bacterium]
IMTGYLSRSVTAHGISNNIPIQNGETIELEITDEVESVFAMPYEGLLSNEIILDRSKSTIELEITTKGGWKTLVYPELKQK